MKHTVRPKKVERSKEEKPQECSFLDCDAHRKYSVMVAVDEQERTSAPLRVEHDRKEPRSFLRRISGTGEPSGRPGSCCISPAMVRSAREVNHHLMIANSLLFHRNANLHIPFETRQSNAVAFVLNPVLLRLDLRTRHPGHRRSTQIRVVCES
jgi:hypothetical protein